MNGKQSSSGIRVRDMVRQYDTKLKSDSVKSSYSSSIGPIKSSYFGLNENNPLQNADYDDFDYLFGDETLVQRSLGSPSRSSNGSQKTVRQSRFDALNDIPEVPLDTQKSFMNLSRSREPPKAAPREKKSRYYSFKSEPQPQYRDDDKLNISDASYQSKTTISKTPNGVRIVVDIYFDQNKGVAIEDVIGSRIETDIPPSKILKEFQKRVADTS